MLIGKYHILTWRVFKSRAGAVMFVAIETSENTWTCKLGPIKNLGIEEDLLDICENGISVDEDIAQVVMANTWDSLKYVLSDDDKN